MWDVTASSVQGVWNLFTGFSETLAGLWGEDVPLENRPLSPIGAVQVGVEVGGRSVADALWLTMTYSVFIGVFNLLPVMPLDGGHLVVNTYEAAASKL